MDDTHLIETELDDALKALSHPVRRQILQWLREPEKHFCSQAHPLEMGICAGQFERCGLSQSTVSAHLASLSKAGLITSHKVGQWIFYKRDEDAIAAFVSRLSARL
ncbi:ArsR/SmtB family transcription factor [Allorhizobium taibaishanense]|uniref:Transcriptional regulator n=1 Tax=Allorhizobium taibaishanense TaxID=887144 RepID=A0A1Q9A3Z6_9HYPH|nr:metalloregulator ArsR/SmtB family transcription factor [Allorhizobium taibaishanense]MBB4006285.1 ArsR family transcriptional regulator [Allorhizobium taibaishanense]OLP49252.1 transcriptional regulator [Allorhizobium taibaishanense]